VNAFISTDFNENVPIIDCYNLRYLKRQKTTNTNADAAAKAADIAFEHIIKFYHTLLKITSEFFKILNIFSLKIVMKYPDLFDVSHTHPMPRGKEVSGPLTMLINDCKNNDDLKQLLKSDQYKYRDATRLVVAETVNSRIIHGEPLKYSRTAPPVPPGVKLSRVLRNMGAHAHRARAADVADADRPRSRPAGHWSQPPTTQLLSPHGLRRMGVPHPPSDLPPTSAGGGRSRSRSRMRITRKRHKSKRGKAKKGGSRKRANLKSARLHNSKNKSAVKSRRKNNTKKAARK
jgi:hypothetical protein